MYLGGNSRWLPLSFEQRNFIWLLEYLPSVLEQT